MAILLRRRGLGFTSCKGIISKSKQKIQYVRNDHKFPSGHKLCFRWGCTSTIPIKKVVNIAKAIHIVNDKLSFRELMNKYEIGSLITYFNIKDAIKENDFPYVVRPRRHSRGRHVYFCESPRELKNSCISLGRNNFYISPFVDKTSEYRVFVVSGRVACVARKYPGENDQVAWNVARGGRFENVRWGDWNLKAVRIAIEAFDTTGLDFGGVDVMADDDNNIYVLEINSAPSLTSNYRQQCFAKSFDYIIKNGKNKIPLIEKLGGWKKFIHPAVSERAKLR